MSMALTPVRPGLSRAEKLVDRLATVSALLVIPVILVEQYAADPLWLQLASMTSWLIWWAFVADGMLKLATYGVGWLRTWVAWVSIVIIVLSYPALTQWIAAARVARLARFGRAGRVLNVIRLLRLGVIITRALSGLRRILNPRSFPYVALAVAGIVLIGGAALYFAEIEGTEGSVEDALWWAVVTVTTVGYGDITPATTLGRIVAGVVMIVGITFVSLLTAHIASHLTLENQEDMAEKMEAGMARLEERQERMSAELKRLAEKIDGLQRFVDGG